MEEKIANRRENKWKRKQKMGEKITNRRESNK
jgi:hypothetical protein